MSDKGKKAKALFLAGANCAQAVLGAFADEYGLPEETAFRLAAGFGGGIARMREVCGALSGMVMAAGLLFAEGRIGDKAAKDAHYALIRRLADRYRERAGGSIVCRELLGLAPRQCDAPVSEARTVEYYRKRPCARLVEIAAEILEEALREAPEQFRPQAQSAGDMP